MPPTIVREQCGKAFMEELREISRLDTGVPGAAGK